MKTRSSTLMRASRAAIAALALAAIAACADEERAVPFVETDAGPDVVTKPPPSGDAGAAPPDADAGPPEYDAAVQTVVCAQAARQPCVTDLVAGENHFCALLDGGTVQCWGANARGALGFSDDEHVPGPSAVKDLTGATQLSSDGLVTCALLGNGEAACWGSNEHGQLARTDGDGGSVVDTLPHSSRETIPLPSKLARIDVGRRTVSGLTAAGDLYVWGRNDKGALARPDAGTSAMVAGPALADRGGFAIKQVASSDESLYGLTADAGLVNWGTVSGRESSLTPTAAMVPLSLADVTALTAGPAHACAIAGGRVACWGQNAYGVLHGDQAPDPGSAGVDRKHVASRHCGVCARNVRPHDDRLGLLRGRFRVDARRGQRVRAFVRPREGVRRSRGSGGDDDARRVRSRQER